MTPRADFTWESLALLFLTGLSINIAWPFGPWACEYVVGLEFDCWPEGKAAQPNGGKRI